MGSTGGGLAGGFFPPPKKKCYIWLINFGSSSMNASLNDPTSSNFRQQFSITFKKVGL